MNIVHILGKFDQGGVEMLLKEIYFNTDAQKHKLFFVLLDESTGYYDDDLIENGATLIRIPLKKGIANFYNKFTSFLKSEKIDVVHSHVQAFSGYLLWIAKNSGIRVRIAHSHSDETQLNKNVGIGRKLYLKLGQKLIASQANLKIACSSKAGQSLFPNQEYKLLHNGIDHSKFSSRNASRREEYLREFNLEKDTIIIGHVGRLAEVKNHFFLLEVVKSLVAMKANVCLVCCGAGPLQEAINNRVKELDIEDNVRLVGPRRDIPDLMSHLFDGFIMTSHYEGLPLVLVEAQIAGLYCLIPDHISTEVEVFSELVEYLSLEESAASWAKTLLKGISNTNSDGQYLNKFVSTPFTLTYMINELLRWYNIKHSNEF